MNISESIKKFADFITPEAPKDDSISGISSDVVSLSDSTYLVSAAARICVGMKPVEDYEKRKEHISRVVGRGHESVLEHTNIIMVIHFTSSSCLDVLRLSESFRYLHWHITEEKNTDSYNEIEYKEKEAKVKNIVSSGNKYHLLLGGSIRAYKNIFKETKELSSNPIYEEIKNNLYCSAEKVFFKDLIEDGIMDENSFGFIPRGNMNYEQKNEVKDGKEEVLGTECTGSLPIPNTIVGDRVDIIQAHNTFQDVYDKVKGYGFTIKDVLDVVSVSVIFHDISRPISMQINRHRNAISQESQRYVDYSNKGFVDPSNFIEGEPLGNFSVNIFGATKELSLADLGKELVNVYPQLINQGLLKQDARSFLPSNVCTKLMMTFTYRNLFHFLDMRLSKGAQAEVRAVAEELDKKMRKYDPYIYNLFALSKEEIEQSKEDLVVSDDYTPSKIISYSESPVYIDARDKENSKRESIDEVIDEEIVEGEN